MPFKTKSKKMSASGRHTFTFSTNTQLSYGDSNAPAGLKSKEVKTSRIEAKIETDYKYVKSELVKIALIASIIIGLQLALKFSGFTIF